MSGLLIFFPISFFFYVFCLASCLSFKVYSVFSHYTYCFDISSYFILNHLIFVLVRTYYNPSLLIINVFSRCEHLLLIYQFSISSIFLPIVLVPYNVSFFSLQSVSRLFFMNFSFINIITFQKFISYISYF